MLANAHCESVDVVDVTDAIVHEAIHALLFMQERRKRWVLDEKLYDSTPRSTSPWTGRELPLRAFLQANFVWYGLLNFWLKTHSATLKTPVAWAPLERIRSKISAASVGFLGVSLVDSVAEFKSEISTDILAAIDVMQSRVRVAFSRV